MHDQRASCCVHTGPGTLLPDGDTLAIAGFALQAVRIYVFLLPFCQAWTVVPTVLSDADAAHLVGMCAACKRAEGDPLKVLQLGVSISGASVGYKGDFESHATRRESQLAALACVAVAALTFRILY